MRGEHFENLIKWCIYEHKCHDETTHKYAKNETCTENVYEYYSLVFAFYDDNDSFL